MKLLKANFRDLNEYVGKHFTDSGGWRELFSSPYLIISLVLTVLSYKLWCYDAWWTLPVGILPNLLGFSLGGYAIMLAFGNQRFQRALVSAKEEDGRVVFDSLHSQFVHFVLIQVTALLLAILARALDYPPPTLLVCIQACVHIPLVKIANFIFRVYSFIGYLIFVYAITLGASCVLTVYMSARGLKAAIETDMEIEKESTESAGEIDPQSNNAHGGQDESANH